MLINFTVDLAGVPLRLYAINQHMIYFLFNVFFRNTFVESDFQASYGTQRALRLCSVKYISISFIQTQFTEMWLPEYKSKAISQPECTFDQFIAIISWFRSWCDL